VFIGKELCKALPVPMKRMS